jgi:hypothetical protein
LHRDTEIWLQPGDKTAKKTPVLSCNHGVHSFLREVEPYPIILGGGLSRYFARSLQDPSIR